MTSLADDLVSDVHDAGAAPSADASAQRSRQRRRRVVAAVVVAFLVTRVFAGYVADHPDFYGADRPDGTGDVQLYDYFSWEMRHDGLAPYGETLRMEYPPGAIPIIMVPRFIRAVDYRSEFVILMVLFDALGLVALVRIARRTGSWWGFATWFVLVPALGPVSYTRLDLVVGVALLWAVERALAGKWGHVGVLIGIGAAIKLVPAVFIPMLFFVVPRDRRRAFLGGFAAVAVVAIVPFIDMLPDVYRSVIQYHTERGVQAESIWGAGLLAARWVADYPVRIIASHRAWDARADVAPLLKTLSNVASVAVVAGALVLAARTKPGELARETLLLFGTLSLLVGIDRVYSPQYVLWLIALGAAAMALTPRRAAPAVAVLGVTTVLAHLEFPIWFWDVLFYDKGGALLVLIARDVLTIVVGVMAVWAWRHRDAIDLTVVPPGDDVRHAERRRLAHRL